MRAVLDHIVEHAPTLRSYWFRPDVPLRFTAGEYTEVYLQHTPHDIRGERRKFTVSSSPTDPLVSITVTFVPDSGSSFKAALAALRPGDSVHMAETMGEFVLPKDPTIPLTFTAVGAGITPVMSIVAWLDATGEKRDVQIIHGARLPSTLLDQALFAEYAQKYMPIVTQPDDTWSGMAGQLTASRILDVTNNPSAQRYYLSGPEAMIKKLADNLIDLGIDKNAIVTDLFLGVADE
ncbi:MAG: ferredoxin--NADP reductase [Candidatus Saccharibacteria bacterium]